MPYEAKTAADFVRHLAVNYVSRGYVFYVRGEIPPHKDPRDVDAKIAHKYDTEISKWRRARRKRKGLANVQYCRFGRRFVLLATPGEHRFFKEELSVLGDLRRRPLQVAGYSISSRLTSNGWRVRVQLTRKSLARLKRALTSGVLENVPGAINALQALRWAPFSGVETQLKRLVKAANRMGFVRFRVIRHFDACELLLIE